MSAVPGFNGFETGDLLEAVAFAGSVSITTAETHSGAYALQVAPAGAATAYYRLGFFGPASDFATLQDVPFLVNQIVYFRFYLFITSAPPIGSPEEIFRCNDASGNLVIAIAIDAANLYIDGGTSVHSYSLVLTPGTWHKISLEFPAGINGLFTIAVDGATIGAGGERFGQSLGGVPASAYLGKYANANSAGYTIVFDDVYWGMFPPPSDSFVALMTPNGEDGMTTIPWTGTFQDIDSVPPSPATPLTTSTPNALSAFTFIGPGQAGIPFGSMINNVKMIATMKLAAGTAGAIVVATVIGGGGYSSNTTALTTSYAHYGQTLITNPQAIRPWNWSDLLTIEAAIENFSGPGNTVDCIGLYFSVDYTPPGPPAPPPAPPAPSGLPDRRLPRGEFDEVRTSGFPEFDAPGPKALPPCGRDMLRRGMHWLTRQLRHHASEEIVYVDQLGNRIACRATLGTKLLKLDDMMGGFRIEWTDMDFLIEARQLRIALEGPSPFQIVPTRGDQIVLVIGDDEQTFEVAPYGSDPPWRWTDPFQTMMRVHTKLLDITPYS